MPFATHPRVANAGCSHHADHLAVTIDCAVQQALDGGHLPPPTDQIRLSTPHTVVPFSHAQQPLGRYRLVGTLDPHQLWLAESRSAIDKPRG